MPLSKVLNVSYPRISCCLEKIAHPRRLTRHASSALFTVQQSRCWSALPNARPTAVQSAKMLSVILRNRTVTTKLRRLLLGFTIAAIAAVTFGLVLFVWRSPHRSGLATFWSFAAALAVIALSLTGRAVGRMTHLRRMEIQPADENQEKALNYVADLLAQAVKDQWIRGAADRWLLQVNPIPVRWRRCLLPVTGPTLDAVGSRNFPPLPGLAAVRHVQLQTGWIWDLHTIYGGLRSGRLVIVGSAGSGKSGAAVLLILAALRHREHLTEGRRLVVPVPVLFTMHGWDPNVQSPFDWLAMQLRNTYPIFAGGRGAANATALVAAGKIAVILDGLDEIAPELRPVALRALSQQAAFRLVIVARSAEMVSAAEESFLEGAVALELQDVEPAASADYLTSVQRDPPPLGWQELTDRLRCAPESPIAKALSNPLALTLVRDTYRSADDVRELLDFCDASPGLSREDVEDFLLARVLPAAYAPQPGQDRLGYDLETARRTLSHLATLMNQEGTRDLAWWRIPAWTSRTARVVTAGLMAGVGFGFFGALAADVVMSVMSASGQNLDAALGFGLIIGLVAGLAGGLGGRGCGNPVRPAPLRWRNLFSHSSLVVGLSTGLLAGLVVTITDDLSPDSLRTFFLTLYFWRWLHYPLAVLLFGDSYWSSWCRGVFSDAFQVGLPFAAITGLMTWLTVGFTGSGIRFSALRLALRRQHLTKRSTLAAALLTALASGLVGGCVIALVLGRGVVFGVQGGLIVGLMVGFIVTFGWHRDGFSVLNPSSIKWGCLSTATAVRIGFLVALASGVLGGAVLGLASGVGDGLENKLAIAVRAGLVVGFLVGIIGWLVAGLMGNGGRSAETMGSAQWQYLFDHPAFATAVVTGLIGLMFGSVGSLGRVPGYSAEGVFVPYYLVCALSGGLRYGLVSSLVFGLWVGLSASILRAEPVNMSPATPIESWRRDRTCQLVAGLVGGLVSGLIIGSGLGFILGIGIRGVVSGMISGCVIGLVFGLVFATVHSDTWPSSLAFVQLASGQRTPLRLMRFLEDARQRQILRTVGPTYQFRHARLQDRLAFQHGTSVCHEQKAGTSSVGELKNP